MRKHISLAIVVGVLLAVAASLTYGQATPQSPQAPLPPSPLGPSLTPPAVPSTVLPAVPSTVAPPLAPAAPLTPVPATGFFNPPDTRLPGSLTTPGLSTLPGITDQRSAAGGSSAPSLLNPAPSSPARFCTPGSIFNPC